MLTLCATNRRWTAGLLSIVFQLGALGVEAAAETPESVILSAHAAHPATLATELESDAALRASYLDAHLTLAGVANLYPSDHPERAEVDAFLRALVSDEAGVSGAEYFQRGRVYDGASEKLMSFLRERLARTWLDLLPASAGRKQELADRLNFGAARRELLVTHGVLFMDNDRASAAQLAVLHDLLEDIPASLHDTEGIGSTFLIGEADGALPPDLEWWSFWEGRGNEINIFGSQPGEGCGNQFPGDVPAKTSCVFTDALAHELNHVVDAYAISPSGALQARKSALIARAACAPENYLRSTLPTCFFVDAPAEFFASMANVWFSSSENVLRLATTRFDSGRKEPLNQFLFFLDVYSEGSLTSYFYEQRTDGTVARRSVPLERDASGRIVALVDRGSRYGFTLDAGGFVTSYQETNSPCVPSELVLCVDAQPGDRRFRVEATYATSQGGGFSGDAHAVPLDSVGVSRGGLFWFFSADNPELLVKVLDGCGLNNRFWIYLSAGTNVGVELTVADTATGETWTLSNPDGTPLPTIQDTAALPCQ